MRSFSGSLKALFTPFLGVPIFLVKNPIVSESWQVTSPSKSSPYNSPLNALPMHHTAQMLDDDDDDDDDTGLLIHNFDVPQAIEVWTPHMTWNHDVTLKTSDREI